MIEMSLEVRSSRWQTCPMTDIPASAKTRYDLAAPRWGDKMRTLGYYDAYLGFLSAVQERARGDVRVIDVGAGTASFAEAWVAINGVPRQLTLLDPSLAMLECGRAALNRREIQPRLVQQRLGEGDLEPVEAVLAAHVIEHCGDPSIALRQLHDMLCPGGTLHLVVSKPHWCNAIIWLQWRHRTFHQDEILQLMKATGFEVERVYDFPSGPPSRTSRGFIAKRAG